MCSLIKLVLESQCSVCSLKSYNLRYTTYYCLHLTSDLISFQYGPELWLCEINFDNFCSALIWKVTFTNYSWTAYKLVHFGQVFLHLARQNWVFFFFITKYSINITWLVEVVLSWFPWIYFPANSEHLSPFFNIENHWPKYSIILVQES